MKMDKIIFCVLVAVVAPSCFCMKSWELPKEDLIGFISPELHEPWMSYKKSYNKTYSSIREEITRRLYWEDNYRYIHEHNEKYNKGESTFYLGENDMTDMAEDEWKEVFMSGLIVPEEEPDVPVFTGEGLPDPPLEKDWRQSGMVTPVKNQGRCGSCWAFSAAAAIEGSNKKKTGRLVDLSEQNLLDCARRGNYGCRGGWMNNAFSYVKSNGGIDSEACYPYRNYQYSCRYRSSCKAATISSFSNVGKAESYLERAAATVGPIAIATDANHRSFMSYRGGLYYERACNPRTPPSHAMTLVGYGATSRGKYWLVKNSWGTGWGQGGYVFMAKDRGNNCRIASYASYPR